LEAALNPATRYREQRLKLIFQAAVLAG